VKETYGAVRMLCGRTLGYVAQRRFFAQPDSPKLKRQGQRLRCGACGGGILFEADPKRVLPDWVAEAVQQALARPTRQGGGTD
jgi:hypothetical protein